MENIIAVMKEKYLKGSGARSVRHLREVLDAGELNEFDAKHYDSFDKKVDGLMRGIISHVYQDGVSAGKKLAAKDGMNEIDAVTFVINQLAIVKDDLKDSIAEELVKKEGVLYERR